MATIAPRQHASGFDKSRPRHRDSVDPGLAPGDTLDKAIIKAERAIPGRIGLEQRFDSIDDIRFTNPAVTRSCWNTSECTAISWASTTRGCPRSAFKMLRRIGMSRYTAHRRGDSEPQSFSSSLIRPLPTYTSGSQPHHGAGRSSGKD
jgi:hypothetical protein